MNLHYEFRLWTDTESVQVKDTDFGAFKYDSKIKQSLDKNVYAAAKQIYGETRGLSNRIDSKYKKKLKRSLKQLEELMQQKKIVYCAWKNHNILQMMFCTGLLVYIAINVQSGDINNIVFDKFLTDKLISDTITDVLITKQNIMIAYNINQITFISFQKLTTKSFNTIEKINDRTPIIYNVLISGDKKIPRYLVCNKANDMLMIWTKSSQSEVFPWRPTVKDQDRANLHIYLLSPLKIELLSYYWTENDPICLEFSIHGNNQINIVEQKISKKGEVTIESSIYQVQKLKLLRLSITTIPIQTQICCSAYSPDQEKLLVGCIDGSILLFDSERGITHMVKAAFIPSIVSWHCDSTLVTIANERCQIQCYDIALACVKNQLLNEESTPSNLLDLSVYLASPQSLAKMCWSKKPDIAYHQDPYTQNDTFLLLAFDNGPLAFARVCGGAGLKGDIHQSGFTGDVLVHKYLATNQVEKAINILLCLNWDAYGAMCLLSLHRIANFIFKTPHTLDLEMLLQKALGSFHTPVKALCPETEAEFLDQVNDLTRRFFFYLLRNQSFEKAFSLAIDINDVDLFLLLHQEAKVCDLFELSNEALVKAREIYNIEDMEDLSTGSSSETGSSGSFSSTENSDDERYNDEEVPIVNKSVRDPNHDRDDEETYDVLAKIYNNPGNRMYASYASKVPAARYKRDKDTDKAAAAYVPPLPYSPQSQPSSLEEGVHIRLPKKSLSSINLNNLPYSHHSAGDEADASSSFFPIRPTLKNFGGSQELLSYSKHDHQVPFYGASTNQKTLKSNAPPPLASHDTDFYSNLHRWTATTSKSMGHKSSMPSFLNSYHEIDQQDETHVVIDVVPRVPTTKQPPIQRVLDQTVGIPLVPAFSSNNQLSYTPLTHTLSGSLPMMPKNFKNYLPNDHEPAPPPPKFIHQYPLISATIPSKSQGLSTNSRGEYLPSAMSSGPKHGGLAKKNEMKSSILSNNTTGSNENMWKKESSEKQKVKFSDTITVAVVPEIPRKERMFISNEHRRAHPMYADPKKELAESLPLCHPHDDWLKDFAPVQDRKDDADDEDHSKGGKNIKVIHFGVV